MALIPKTIRRLSNFLNVLAGWSLVAMTLLTCADVLLRIFRCPIRGTYEVIGFLGAAAAAFAMAHTTLQRGHVAVEVLVANLGHRLRWILYLVTQALSIFLFVLIAYESLGYGRSLKAASEVSLTLQLPFYPVLYGISVSSVVVCLVLLVDLWRVATGAARPWYRWWD
jgi:TRAP-type C4-dicarboxylate transport system permease small subunit